MESIVSQGSLSVESTQQAYVAAAPSQDASPQISSRMTGGEIERIVRREVPIGSWLVEAQEFLTAAGFECQLLRGETAYFGAIRELHPRGDGILRATLSNDESHWPSRWTCVVDIHIVRNAVADCRAFAFTTR